MGYGGRPVAAMIILLLASLTTAAPTMDKVVIDDDGVYVIESGKVYEIALQGKVSIIAYTDHGSSIEVGMERNGTIEWSVFQESDDFGSHGKSFELQGGGLYVRGEGILVVSRYMSRVMLDSWSKNFERGFSVIPTFYIIPEDEKGKFSFQIENYNNIRYIKIYYINLSMDKSILDELKEVKVSPDGSRIEVTIDGPSAVIAFVVDCEGSSELNFDMSMASERDYRTAVQLVSYIGLIASVAVVGLALWRTKFRE